MSDDGYYDDDYDDLEDTLWDADPAPDLADDLAEHAAYSPVWQNDPVGELETYHSDWEYYSDDYYDDDPLLKQSTLDGGPVQSKTRTKAGNMNRGKKRKLHEAREVLTVGGKGSLLASIRGTVWAQDESKDVDIFYKGQQEKVALLSNWRDLFNKDGNAHTFGRGQLQRDESWANDMSLADMGLLNERDKSNVQAEPLGENELSHDDEPGHGIDDSEQDEETEVSEEAEVTSLIHPDKIRALPTAVVDNDDYISGDNFESTIHSRKRLRSSRLPSPPPSNESNSAGHNGDANETSEPDVGRKRLKRGTKQFNKHTTKTVTSPDPVDENMLEQHQEGESRKRKAIVETDDGRNHEELYGRRVKKVASGKLKQEEPSRGLKIGSTPKSDLRSR